MGTLEPENSKMMAYYVSNISEFIRIADGCRIPRFSDALRAELLGFLGNAEAVQMVEGVTRIGDHGNVQEIASLRRAVSRQLKARGVHVRKGKRTAAGLLEFVECLTPLLLRFGLPLATSERSKLVRALRAIADEIGVPGDPRDELRRLRRVQKEEEALVRRLIKEAVRKGLAPLGRVNPP